MLSPSNVQVIDFFVKPFQLWHFPPQAKGRELERAIIAQEKALKSGSRAMQKAYATAIEKLGPVYNAEARQALRENNKDKATVLITKKKLCETEAAYIKSRL